MPSPLRIAVHSPAPAGAAAVIDAGLDEYNTAAAPLSDVHPLHVVAEDADGMVVGGAIGRTWGQCCELQQLWVTPKLRANRIGSQLMDAFEQGARRRGCLLVYLDTFSFQAPGFYRARGYDEALRIDGFTDGIIKFTMQKRLHANHTAS